MQRNTVSIPIQHMTSEKLIEAVITFNSEVLRAVTISLPLSLSNQPPIKVVRKVSERKLSELHDRIHFFA